MNQFTNNPLRGPDGPPDGPTGGDLVAPLSPALRGIHGVLDRIKSRRDILVVQDDGDADDDGLEREIFLAPRNGRIFTVRQINELTCSLAPEGVDIDELDEEELESDEDEDSDESESEVVSSGGGSPELVRVGSSASFSLEVIMGKKRTVVKVEIDDPDMVDVWERFGGVGDSDENSEDLVYRLTVYLFASEELAHGFLAARGYRNSSES